MYNAIDTSRQVFVSTQVLQEFCNVVHKKFSALEIDLETSLSEIESIFSIHDNNIETVRKANAIKKKYGYSFYDSLIIAAALECSCKTLYSEDMHHGQIIENRLKIINPFK